MNGFVGPHILADVTVVTVTYNSADAIDDFIDSLRRASVGLQVRVVLVDNESTDDTVARVSKHSDVVLVRAGGNLGYAGGINAARDHLGQCHSVLILNPDLVLDDDAVRRLRTVLADPEVGVAVPRLVDSTGATSTSLRNEPSLVSALFDAAVGSKLVRRPRRTGETLHRLELYESRRTIDWATGAALLARKSVVDAVGDWDEQFFLYSEETDFFRRVRELGWTVMFDPSARVCHHGAGSGVAPALSDLMAVNRIRYVEKYHSATYSALFRLIVVTAEAARGRVRTAKIVMNPDSWTSLPRRTSARIEHMGSIVVPAHNESSVIGRTLLPLVELTRKGIVEVIVVCNGCSDDTARVASTFEGVTVLEIETASKVAALNAGDRAARLWPRIYLDADVVLTANAAVEVLSALRAGAPLAARPSSVYDVSGASFWVRRYYVARSKIPSFRRTLWGAGCYALSEAGHRRLGSFPDVIADDVYVDNLFDASEKLPVVTDPVVISVPRNARSLISVLGRNYRGNHQLDTNTIARQSFRELLGTARGPVGVVDVCVYVGFAVAGRVAARRNSSTRWQRDLSSR